MPELNLRVSAADWDGLRKHCAPSFRGLRDTEFGTIGLLGKRVVDGSLKELIIARILWPERGDVIAHPHCALTFSSRYLRRAHMAMREEGLAGLLTVHTHPMSDTNVGFSGYDDRQDPLLMDNLVELWPGTWLSSLVLGARSQMGRLWVSPTKREELATLVSVGERLRYLPLNGKPVQPAPKPSEIFDRAKAITGNGALAQLSRRTAVVAGASGTGSLVCELLARGGSKRIMTIDHDVVKDANLNRILYATREDAQLRRPKVEVLKRGIESLGLDCEIEPVVGSILNSTVLKRLNEADFIFGCVDKDFPRMILCQYAYQYRVPYIDVGAEIGGDDEGIVSTDARANYVAPGRWCLRCTGLINPRRLAFESLTGPERKRRIALGYSDDLMLKQPAVMDLNMRAASMGMLILRHLLQPFLLDPLPATLAENLVTYNMKPLATARAKNELCDICRSNPTAGFGDCGVSIGLPSEVAASLIEGDDDAE
jgi:hypothetical protein